MANSPSIRKILWDNLNFNKIEINGGFSVELVHACPEVYLDGQTPDSIVASAARTSFNKYGEIKDEKSDSRLIDYLYRNKHTSPFEMATLTFLVKAPKFVTIQLLRHRTFRFNEESQRYHQIKDGFFHPSSYPEQFIRRQDPKNKQGSMIDAKLSSDIRDKFIQVENKLEEIFKLYDEMIELGAARECARFCLPMSTWSCIAIQCDMNNLTKFLSLRLADDAQYETQLISQAMYLLARQVFPVIMNAFDEHSSIKIKLSDQFNYTFTS